VQYGHCRYKEDVRVKVSDGADDRKLNRSSE
jgi:hypothetical protein